MLNLGKHHLGRSNLARTCTYRVFRQHLRSDPRRAGSTEHLLSTHCGHQLALIDHSYERRLVFPKVKVSAVEVPGVGQLPPVANGDVAGRRSRDETLRFKQYVARNFFSRRGKIAAALHGQ